MPGCKKGSAAKVTVGTGNPINPRPRAGITHITGPAVDDGSGAPWLPKGSSLSLALLAAAEASSRGASVQLDTSLTGTLDTLDLDAIAAYLVARQAAAERARAPSPSTRSPDVANAMARSPSGPASSNAGTGSTILAATAAARSLSGPAPSDAGTSPAARAPSALPYAQAA